jgi:phospholipase/carboxylesterase
MQTVETIEIASWVVRLRQPGGQGPHPVALLLHGWTGDEKVMWVFAPRLSKKALLVAPRGLYGTPLGGYGWHDHQLGLWPKVSDFRPAVDALLDLMRPQNFTDADLSRMHLVGFSQGAALGFAFGLMYPERVASITALSGFFPEAAESFIAESPLAGIPVFLAHGARDEIVVVDKARHAVAMLKTAGAEVLYCEDDVGHKLSVSCFESLEHFHASLT